MIIYSLQDVLSERRFDLLAQRRANGFGRGDAYGSGALVRDGGYGDWQEDWRGGVGSWGYFEPHPYGNGPIGYRAGTGGDYGLPEVDGSGFVLAAGEDVA